MAPSNNYVRDVMARFEDFVGPGVQWQRALWEVGAVSALSEVKEASDGERNGALSSRAVKRHAESVIQQVSSDPGAGDEQSVRRLRSLLTQDLSAGGVNYNELLWWIDDLESHFLARWQAAVVSENKPSREQFARALSAELLRVGFSPAFLRDWMRSLREAQEEISGGNLVEKAIQLSSEAPEDFQIMLVVTRPPARQLSRPDEWRSAKEVAAWLKAHGFRPVRQHGGILLQVQARDGSAAAQQGADVIHRLLARAAVGTREDFRFHELVFVGGMQKGTRIRVLRRAEVRTLEREDTLLNIDASGPLDQALELLSHLNTGPAAVAAAAGWAAVESLLSGPGDADKGITADRLASLVACSWPRAELTTIAWARVYQCGGDLDELASELKNLPTNRARADRILTGVRAGENLSLEWPAEQMALRRMEKLLSSPRSVLLAVRDRAGDALRRLYRQRNLVVHGGQTGGFGLAGALRTATPLVGAGLDRLTHAAVTVGTPALELAARAQFEVERAGTAQAPALTELLE